MMEYHEEVENKEVQARKYFSREPSCLLDRSTIRSGTRFLHSEVSLTRG